MTTEHDQGDYVLVHKSKAKISRARKMVIGVMAIGAVAAMTNAGTFASFSASTTNDATFRTGTLDLSNKVNTATACFASGTNTAALQGSDTFADENSTGCTTLFGDNLQPGKVATAELTLTNTSTSDYTGKLSVFADNTTFATCVNEENIVDPLTTAGSGNLCSAVEMTIQEASGSTFAPGGLTCVWPAGCVLDDNADYISTFAGLYKPAAAPTGPTTLPLATSLAPNTAKYFVISLKLKDNGLSSTGVGAENIYQNKKANFVLRFLLQDI